MVAADNFEGDPWTSGRPGKWSSCNFFFASLPLLEVCAAQTEPRPVRNPTQLLKAFLNPNLSAIHRTTLSPACSCAAMSGRWALKGLGRRVIWTCRPWFLPNLACHARRMVEKRSGSVAGLRLRCRISRLGRSGAVAAPASFGLLHCCDI